MSTSFQSRSAVKPGTSKTPSASALIVATAATKWRRKRKTNYLFGPPNKSHPEQQKQTTEQTKRPVILVQEISNKKQVKPENVQKPVDQNNKEQNDLLKSKQSRKCITKKRERDGLNKMKVSCSSNCIADKRVKNENLSTRANSCVEGVKIVKRSQIPTENGVGDSDEKKEKKTEGGIGEVKKQRRSEPKSACDKVKRSPESVKNVMLPFDKSQSAYRGFRGRTRQQAPAMLWGNGRDWRTPVQHEGDWGRIYPLNHNYNSKEVPEFEEDYMGNKFTVGDKQIRLVVHHVTKFIKISKQLYSSGLYSTEEELNAQLMKNLGLTCEVWLPSK